MPATPSERKKRAMDLVSTHPRGTRMVHATPNIFIVPKMQNRRPYRTSRTCRDSQSQGMCVCVHALAKREKTLQKQGDIYTEIQEQNKKRKLRGSWGNDNKAVSNPFCTESQQVFIFHLSFSKMYCSWTSATGSLQTRFWMFSVRHRKSSQPFSTVVNG